MPGYTALSISVQASLQSTAYNVGVGAICRSTAAKLASARDYVASCHAVTRFNRAPIELCLTGFPQ